MDRACAAARRRKRMFSAIPRTASPSRTRRMTANGTTTNLALTCGGFVRLDLVGPVVRAGARVRLEVACRLHDARLADRRERRPGHERVDEPLAVRRVQVDVEQDLPELRLMLRGRREDELERQLVPRPVLDRPPVELRAGGRIRVDRNVAVAPLLPRHARFHRRREHVVGRGRVVPLDRVVDEDVERLVDRSAVRRREVRRRSQGRSGERERSRAGNQKSPVPSWLKE